MALPTTTREPRRGCMTKQMDRLVAAFDPGAVAHSAPHIICRFHVAGLRGAKRWVALPILQKILNHASAATTSRYYQLDSNPGRDALQKYAPRFRQLVSTLAPKELLAVEEDDDPGPALV